MGLALLAHGRSAFAAEVRAGAVHAEPAAALLGLSPDLSRVAVGLVASAAGAFVGAELIPAAARRPWRQVLAAAVFGGVVTPALADWLHVLDLAYVAAAALAIAVSAGVLVPEIPGRVGDWLDVHGFRHPVPAKPEPSKEGPPDAKGL